MYLILDYFKFFVVNIYRYFIFTTNAGRKLKMAMTDMTKPPMVPAAKGNQKASLEVPTINGMKPRIVLIIVRKMGITLAFQAFT